jgi:fimbrial chaperone protein
MQHLTLTAVRGTALFSCALGLTPVTAVADPAVDPVRIELSPKEQTAVISISNNTDEAVSIQIHSMAWRQVDGVDIYEPTIEMLVAPPNITIAPRSEQQIRSALRRRADDTTELAYRIYLQELVSTPEPDFTGLQDTLRIGLPVFVQPRNGISKSKLFWGIEHSGTQHLKVTLKNDGNSHVQVTGFTLNSQDADRPFAGDSGSTYVLAGQSHEWLLRADAAMPISAGALRLKAYTDDGYFETELQLAAQ